MNRSDFTSSNGNRNDKRNQGAASCGARAEQHHKPRLILLDRSVPDAAKHGRANAQAFRDSRRVFADFVPILAAEPLWEPTWFLHTVFSLFTTKTENASGA
jgi:hypothetical protein